jgi:hypothetical protein
VELARRALPSVRLEQQVTQEIPACKVTLGVRDLPDQPVPLPEQLEPQEKLELPEKLAKQVTQVQVRLELPDTPENPVPPGEPGHLELQVNLVKPGRLAARELAAALAKQVLLDPSARRVPLDLRVRPEKLAQLEPQEKREQQALLVTLGLLERRELREVVAQVVGQDLAERPEQLELAVQQVLLGRQAAQGAQEHQERRDRLERLVQAALPDSLGLLERLGLLDQQE